MKAIVLVGPPFEAQTLYGPFPDNNAAAEWADEQRFDYSYIATLNEPASSGSAVTRPAPPRVLNFGKYRGQTITAVLAMNPQYIRWVYDNVGDHGGITDDEYRKAGGIPRPAPPPAPANLYEQFPDDDIPF